MLSESEGDRRVRLHRSILILKKVNAPDGSGAARAYQPVPGNHWQAWHSGERGCVCLCVCVGGESLGRSGDQHGEEKCRLLKTISPVIFQEITLKLSHSSG